MGKWRVVSLGIVLVVALVAALGVSSPGVAQEQPASDNTVTSVQVHPDGSATWTVRIRTRLPDSESISNYERFQEQFRSNTSRYLDPYRSRIQNTVAGATDATGREMRATNFSASTSIQSFQRTFGIVTYRFTWTNFTQRQEDRLVVGDVFEDGFRITENDAFAVSGPQSATVVNTEPEPDNVENGTVRWEGERDFLSGRPRAVFSLDPAAGDGTATPPDGTGQTEQSPSSPGSPDGPSGPDQSQDGSGGLFLIGVAVVATALLALGAFVVWQRRGIPGSETPGSSADAETESASGSGETEATAAIERVDTETPPEPLTNEQQVTQILEENGGQMRQAEIVEEVDWSKSKTSRVLSSMAEEGGIEKIQLGRENVIRLPTDED